MKPAPKKQSEEGFAWSLVFLLILMGLLCLWIDPECLSRVQWR